MLFIERYAKLSLIVCLSLLVACATKTKTEDVHIVKRHKYEQRAQMLFAQGKYQQAAILYQRLAEKPSAQQNEYRLQAAEALMKGGKNTQAKAYLDLILPVMLNVEQANRLNLLRVQLLINSGKAVLAIKGWQLILFSSLNKQQQFQYYKLGGAAYALSGQVFESVQQQVSLNAYLDSEQRHENSMAIIEALDLASVDDLQQAFSQQQAGIYAGWLEMALILKQFPRGTPEFMPALEAWSQRYPQHSGVALINSGYFLPASIALPDITDIAVLLPESGRYRIYANAIKTGILEAYRQLEQDALQPEIHFYDTKEKSIVALYQQVISEGAQLVIGPLNKKLVIELAENIDLTVPVLALNYAEGLVKDNLYQFALSPIDEVRQVVKHAWSEGYRNAIILAPETAEGERISHYFQNAWQAVEGNVIAVQVFKSGEKDFSLPVRQLLNINESKSRFQKLKNVIGYVEYNPRRRRDVDVIFIVANNSVARLINPQFYHNRAQSVAVYGLSRVYTGRNRVKKDIDLEGVSFCSIPWLFEQAYQGDLNKQSLYEVWQPLSDNLLNLIAFGIDAYTLLPYLNDLASVPYHGATGELVLNEYNRIERYLVCATFNNGKAVLHEAVQDEFEEQENFTNPIPAW